MKSSCTGLPPVNKMGISFDHYAELVAQRLTRRLGASFRVDLDRVRAAWNVNRPIRECVIEIVDDAWEALHQTV